MTNKEYRAKCNQIDYYTMYDMLNADEVKELRQDVKSRKNDGETVLPNSNGRATIRKDSHGRVLVSYYTDVCMITYDGTFVKLWDGYSKTTLKHINLFRKECGFPELNKREWVEIEPYIEMEK